MFINFSNHPYALWSAEQQAAAQRYGTVVDLAFPAIDPAADEAALDSLATVYADHILHLNPDAVLCQGECTFVYRVVQRLEAAGIPTLAACSRRKSQETTYPDGSTLKRSIFAFAWKRARYFALSIFASPAVTTRIGVSPTISASVFAMRHGSQPSAFAARATVALDSPSSRMRESIP